MVRDLQSFADTMLARRAWGHAWSFSLLLDVLNWILKATLDGKSVSHREFFLRFILGFFIAWGAFLGAQVLAQRIRMVLPTVVDSEPSTTQ